MKKVLLKAFAIDEIEKFWAGGRGGGRFEGERH